MPKRASWAGIEEIDERRRLGGGDAGHRAGDAVRGPACNRSA
jgi:hypothetical protein